MNWHFHHIVFFLVTLIFLGIFAVCPALAALDIYGGDTRLTGTATGYFHTEKLNGRYYLITPLGNVFWSVAPTTVGYGGQASLALSYNSDLRVFQGKYYDPTNTLTTQQMWTNATLNRLAAWEQNTIGGFSTDMSGTGIKTSETFRVMFVTERFRSDGGLMLSLARFPDVFDEPKWTNAVTANATSQAAPYATDPYRIGVYPDNEIDWSNRKDANEHLAAAFFEVPNAPGKLHWINNILIPKYTTITALNAAWNKAYTSWTGAESTSFNNQTVIPADNASYPAIHQDKVDFVRAVADKYFSSTSIIFRAADPNHIFFSNRIGLFSGTFEPQFEDFNRAIWEKAGQYCDVVCVNSYQDTASFEAAYGYFNKVFQAAKKPILIGEWNRLGEDGMMPVLTGAGGYANQAKRSLNAIRVAKEYFALSTPNDPNDGLPAAFILGLHWFQLYDEPPTGRFDGERWNAGYLTIMDEGYLTLMEPLRDFWKQKYDYLVTGAALQEPNPPVLLAPKEGEVVATTRPALQWQAVSGASGYDVLLSQTNYFGEEACLKYTGVVSTSLTPSEGLGNGRWYWCVRTVLPGGIGGVYSEPSSFHVHDVNITNVTEVFGFESVAGWRGHERGEAGGYGSALARQSTSIVNSGTASLRLDFAGFSLNRLTNTQNLSAVEASKISGTISEPTWTGAPLMGPKSGLPLKFGDDFSDGNDQGWYYKSGTWTVTSGQYRQSNQSVIGKSGILPSITNAEYQADIRIESAQGPMNWGALLIRRSDPGHGHADSGYLIGIRQNGAMFIYNKVDTLIAEDPGVIADTSVFNTLNVVVTGNTLSVYVNGTLWRSWTDPNNRFPSGYFAVVNYNSSIRCDNIAIYSNETLDTSASFQSQEIIAGWEGGKLDFSNSNTFDFDIYPYRMADQNGTLRPASRYLHVRMIDAVGGVVLDEPVDPAGSFTVESWNTASFPVAATPHANVETLEFYINTGDYLFPLDQRLRVHIDNMTIPKGVAAPVETAPIGSVFQEEFNGSELNGWTAHHGVWGALGGRAYGFAHRDGPSLLLVEGKTVRNATFTAVLQTKTDYVEQRAWIVCGYNPANGSFYYGGFDARNDRYEIGRYDGNAVTVLVQGSTTLNPDTDYTIRLTVDQGRAELRIGAQLLAIYNFPGGQGPSGRFGVATYDGRVSIDSFRMTTSDPSSIKGWWVVR